MTEETEGMRIARERIAQEAEEKTGFLDLGMLGLKILPEELFGLRHLRFLNLGAGVGLEGEEWRAPASHIAPNDLSFELVRLAELPELRNLSLSGALLCYLPPISDLAKLQSLDFHHTKISDLSPLLGCDSLRALDCSFTQIIDVTPLSSLSNLQWLKCSAVQVVDLAPLSCLSTLQWLQCDNTQVADLSPLSKLPLLKTLLFPYTKVVDLLPLSDFPVLEWLDCSDNKISDLSPLSVLSTLKYLLCSNTEIIDLSPLSSLATLEYLRCSGTRIEDLSPLSDLSNLRYLNFSFCRLKRIPVCFWNKTSLKELYLYQTQLPGVPSEVLSLYLLDNCLPRLRTHLRDLEAGATAVSDVKLMVLGNGRVGKTQICRRLRGEDYDDSIPSTHGIEVFSQPVGALFKRNAFVGAVSNRDSLSSMQSTPMESSGLESRLETAPTGQWNIWDFGGQDIYHGTHALFLKTRAVFLLVWATETEFAGEHEQSGMVFRNYPLGYWLDYVRHLAGPDSPVIIVQTRCDRPEDETLHPPLDDAALAAFPFRKVLHYSALENRGRAALDEALAEVAEWLRERQGVSQIGLGRLKVQRRLEALRGDIPNNPQYRTITQEYFRRICEEEGGVSSPEYLLDYLHNTGVLFYRPGLFHDSIVLDQGWALEAIYAMFHRGKSYKPLRQLGGRFTRSLLEALVWREFKLAEQQLFLGMMQSCGICFVHRQGDEEAGIETEFIAPDLLPERSAVESALQWDEEVDCEKLEFNYPLLHPGLLRGLMAEIGNEAGINALYWKDGFYFYENTTRSRAWIEQEAGKGWSGLIRLRTQVGQRGVLLEKLAERMRRLQDYWGLRGKERRYLAFAADSVWRIDAGTPPMDSVADSTVPMPPQAESRADLNIRIEPNEQREICLSYAWADDTPEGQARGEIVEKFCMAAQRRGVKVIRDKTELNFGDSLTRFMQRIGQGNRILVVLSDKYLKSANCMFELFEIWRNSRMDKEEFKHRAGVYRLDCVKIFRLAERNQYAIYWKRQHEEVAEQVRQDGADILGEQGFKEYKLMQDFAHHVGDILDFFKDTLHPGNFEDLEKHEFGPE